MPLDELLSPASRYLWGRFPEPFYPCVSGQREAYERRIRSGIEEMCRTQVVIAGLARNISGIFAKTAARIERLGRMFSDYQVHIFENDSTDNTQELLEAWEANSRSASTESHTLGMNSLAGKEYERVARLAYCRNAMRSAVLRKIHDSKYVIILDTDLLGGWSFDGIANSIGFMVEQREKGRSVSGVASNSIIYDANGSNGTSRRLYYDSWTYVRRGRRTPDTCEKNNLLQFNRGEKPIKVASAFGGLMVYPSDVYRHPAAEYRCLVDEVVVCEHVGFHDTLRAAGHGNFYMNPSQITLYSENNIL